MYRIFLWEKLYKNHSLSCYEQGSNSVHSTKGGKFSLWNSIPYLSHPNTVWFNNSTCMLNHWLFYCAMVWNGTVPYLSTGQDVSFTSSSSFSSLADIQLCPWAGLWKRDGEIRTANTSYKTFNILFYHLILQTYLTY